MPETSTQEVLAYLTSAACKYTISIAVRQRCSGPCKLLSTALLPFNTASDTRRDRREKVKIIQSHRRKVPVFIQMQASCFEQVCCLSFLSGSREASYGKPFNVGSCAVPPCRVTNTEEEMADPSDPNKELIDLGPQYQVSLAVFMLLTISCTKSQALFCTMHSIHRPKCIHEV